VDYNWTSNFFLLYNKENLSVDLPCRGRYKKTDDAKVGQSLHYLDTFGYLKQFLNKFGQKKWTIGGQVL